jgi:RND family efflux transporter MFP subunit
VCLLAPVLGGASGAAAAPDAPEVVVAAEVLALHDVDVPAEVSGRVVARPDDETAAVDKGEVVVALDDAIARQVARAARATAERAKARAEWTAAELEREKALAEKGTSGESALDLARLNQREAEANLVAAEAAAAEAEERLARTRVAAPFAGRLVRIPPERGEYLRVGETAFRIVDDSRLRIVAYLDGAHVARLKVGQAVGVRADFDDAAPVRTARVFSIAAAAEGAARTFRVEARLDNPRGLLRPGMTARLSFVPAAAGG